MITFRQLTLFIIFIITFILLIVYQETLQEIKDRKMNENKQREAIIKETEERRIKYKEVKTKKIEVLLPFTKKDGTKVYFKATKIKNGTRKKRHY